MQSIFPTTPSQLSDDDLAELYAYPSEGRLVRANFVSSLDGAAQGADYKSGTLSSKSDQLVFSMLRSLCDVILVGAGTARIEAYQPVQAHEVRTQLRAQLGLAPVPSVAVVSRSLELDPDLLAGEGAPTLVITTESAPMDLREQVAAVAPVIVAGQVDVDIPLAIDELTGRGYQRMLCEGGPRLMRDLVAVDALDELCLTIQPLIVAGDRLRITSGGEIIPPQSMRLRHLLEADGVLFARYTKGTD